VLTGLFADIAGYGYFSSWWFVAWGSTIVVIVCGLIILNSIIALNQHAKEQSESSDTTIKGISYPFYWILYNSIYIIILMACITGIAISWGASDHFFSQIWVAFNQEVVLGKIVLSLSGFIYALIALLVTYMITITAKKMLTRYILSSSGMSAGAKDSVITICIYLIWSVGILFSLSVFGLDTTSLTVALGALGIGLGFGLQNIFNNFISGLILLFERPIQVGDIVEIGGVWGEVKKINVRSTLVQTYDNSSLILPNSEFISAKVTNWSHKDQFIRRDLFIGVAYGSDTKLVEDLLLEACESVSEVYSYPKPPRVHFINFGDSSLDFRLRFWSSIDDFIPAESNLRFEIDRLFKEHNVVIPFPQRDVHLKNPA
ncbi:MAG: small-conductance mechanosensitive channel, partial [Desulfobacteraceae bacterium]